MIRSFHRDARGGMLLLTSAWALTWGCGVPGAGSEGAPEPEAAPAEGTSRAALTRVTSCENLLERIQEDTIARLVERAEELRQPPAVYSGDPVVIYDDVLPVPPPALAAPEAGSAPNDAVTVGDSPAAPGAAGGFSETTVQVRDVDEADIIDTDGDFIYVLQGNSLVKVRAWPADATQTVASVAIEGSPLEMFVSDGKAVVYSSVYGELAPDLAPASYAPYYYPTFTKLTVLDMAPDTPEVLRESWLEGSYVSARRHGSVVRSILQDGYKVPSLDPLYVEYFTPFGEPYRQEDIDAQVDAWLTRTIWAVTQTELGDWLPRQFSSRDGEIVEESPSCADYYRAELDLSQSGVTQVFSLDLDDDPGTGPLPAATVLARAERVYANDEVVLLAQTDYGSEETGYSETTNLHRFELDGLATRYAASGTLPGYVQSQFSLDEREGIIRVSTTQNRFDVATGASDGPKNRVFTLAASRGVLEILGQTEVFGEDEQIFATRFIGELGYVVTFRQTDPLFVVDLSDPAAPAVVGELVIPGFSNFLYPLGSDHLLSIGRDANEDGVAAGIALQIFDVSDPSAPGLAHKFTYSGSGYSAASFDHRGLVFHPDGGRIAFPLTDYQTGASTLEVFDVDAEGGFTRRGSLAPRPLDITLEECVILLGYGEDALDSWLRQEIDAIPGYAESLLAQCRGMEQMRRGAFREDHVYGVTTQAVYAQQVTQLAEPPSIRASLPPSYDYRYYYPGGGIIAGVAGAAGAAGAASAGVGGGSFDGAAEMGGAGGAPADESP